MIIITVLNDATGTKEKGNYNYCVYSDQTLIASGRIEGHKRQEGWLALTEQMVVSEKLKYKPEVTEEKTVLDNAEKQESRLIPVTKWNEYYDWPTVGGLRHLIFFAEQNGFTQCIRRVGRRVLINESEFFNWVEKNN